LTAAKGIARNGKGRPPFAISPDVGMPAGIIVQLNIRAETGRAGDGAVVPRIFADRRQEAGVALPFMDKRLRVGAAGYPVPKGQVLVDPDQIVDPRFQPVATGLGAVIFMKDERITLDGQDEGVGEQLVAADVFARRQVGVGILDEGHRAEPVERRVAQAIELAHVEARIGAHALQSEMRREVKDRGAAAHRSVRPAVKVLRITIETFTNAEPAGHRRAHPLFDEDGGGPFNVIHAVAVAVE